MIKIVDTTLRDGEQRAGIALGIEEKLKIARLLGKLGIYQIEAGVPAMGGVEKKAVCEIASIGLKSKIAAWNRISTKDVQHSIDSKVDIIHVAAPVSDLQIKSKLNKDRKWVIDNMKKCVNMAISKGFEVTVGLEDASRADMDFILELSLEAYKEGASRVRYADTVGIMHRQGISDHIGTMKKLLPIEIEVHVHNDLGMAVSNSIQAAKSGAEYIDCTIGGIGERAGNCDYLKFIKASKGCLNMFANVELDFLEEVQSEILGVMRNGRVCID